MADVPAQEPKRYIRTFAADAATLQSGGRPELTPLPEKPKSAEATPAPVAQTAPIPIQAVVQPLPAVPEFVPTPPKPKPTPPIAEVPPTFVPPAPVPAPTPAPVVRNAPQTYASDFSARVKETNASTATILAAQQDAATGDPRPTPAPVQRSNVLYVAGALILLAVGASASYYAYSTYLAKQLPIAITPTVSAPIFVDDRQLVAGTSTVLTQAIQQSVAHPLGTGQVRFLYSEIATSSDNSIFGALQLPAPSVLLRNINAEGSMAGVVNAKGTASAFFILSVASYGETFAGMLQWESTMTRDLADFYPAYPAPVVATSTATTTPAKKGKVAVATTTPPVIVGFRDQVIANHDVRVYRDETGNSVILYGYWDQHTLVIARDEDSFTELVRRLATSRSQK